MSELDQVSNFTAETHLGPFELYKCEQPFIVLYFYPKDNTPGCTNESKDFRDHYLEFKKHKCEVIGVSRDSISSHQKFSDKLELPFALISDPDEKVCRLFDVIQLKKFMGKEYMGIVRSTFLLTPNGKIIHSWTKVRVKDHVKNVLATLIEQ